MQSVLTELMRSRERGTFRRLIVADGLLDFSSNDYLGLSRHPEIRKTLIEILARGLPLGSTGSRLLSGNLEAHEEVENFLAQTFLAPSALLFASGYLANLAVTSALGGERTEFFSDELNHASLIDGMRLSKAKRTVFRHNDMSDLRSKLLRSGSARKVLVSESVFSMDGDLAPIGELIGLAREFDAWLVIDEAHATGAIGSRGLGLLEGSETAQANVISIHTCGKALGAQGAFVLSSADAREFLVNFSRPFIYSTAISPILAFQIRAAVSLLADLTAERTHLADLSRSFRESLRSSFNIGGSQSHIVPVILGSNERIARASTGLRQHGFDVRPIRSPTVQSGSERLRVSLKSFHSDEDARRLIATLRLVAA